MREHSVGLLSSDHFSAPPNTIASIGEEAEQVSIASVSQVQMEAPGWSILTLLGSLQMEVSVSTDDQLLARNGENTYHLMHL